MSRTVLIVDDIENVIIRITEFLKRLGYDNVHYANTPNTAIELFQELGKNNEHPLVFLDYDIEGSCGISLLSRLLKLDVDGEIVIMTSLGRESENIRKLIDEGAYEVIQKPIRFETMKNLINIIETENAESQDKKSMILDYFKTTNRISEVWLQENTLANIMNTELRPSIEISENYILLMLKMPHFNEKTGKIDLEQISLILSQNHLLTFQEIEQDFFDKIRQRLRENIGTIRTLPTDYLAYALLDAVIDSYFLVLEKISDISENLEDELVSNPSSNTLHTLRFLKRQMIILRKSIWPAREVLDNLQRSTSPLIHSDTKTFLRDTYNHAVQIIDTTEGLRDLIGGMLDTYLSSLSNKMNEVMKTLTVIASIFIPLTFIAGIYGTNFEYIPELQWHGSYFVMLGAMVITALVMLGWFKKRKWIFE